MATIIRSAESFGTFRVSAATFSGDTEENWGDLARTGWIDRAARWEDDYIYSDWDFRDFIDKLCGGNVEKDGDMITISFDNDFFSNSFPRQCMTDDEISISFTINRPGWISDASFNRVARALGWRKR